MAHMTRSMSYCCIEKNYGSKKQGSKKAKAAKLAKQARKATKYNKLGF